MDCSLQGTGGGMRGTVLEKVARERDSELMKLETRQQSSEGGSYVKI